MNNGNELWLTIKAEGHASSTKITLMGTDIVRDVFNLRLYIKDGIWYADVELSPVRYSVDAKVGKVSCPKCKEVLRDFTTPAN